MPPGRVALLVSLACAACAPDAGARDGAAVDAMIRDAAADDAQPEDGAVIDSAVIDSAVIDASTADAGTTLPPFPDLAIGPYRHLLAMAIDSVESNASSLDTSSTYAHSAAQGYLLQAIGALLWAARGHSLPARDRLIEIALEEIEELRGAADRTTGAAPAFGLEDAWDAFGDGSTNPAFTAYSWQSGMVALGVASIARVLDDVDHPSTAATRDFGVALVERWDAHHTAIDASTGYWWYSTQSSDAIAVHNTSALLAMASQLLSEHGGPASLAAWPRSAVDLLWARTSGNPTIGYRWNYCDDGYPAASRRAEDVSHALVTLQLMRFAGERTWWSASQMQGVAATLLDTMWTGNPARLTGLVDGTRSGDQEWTWTQAAAIGYAAHGDAPGGDPEVFDAARSIVFSSYLARHDRALEGGTVDSVRLLAIALLLAHRPAAFASGSRWEREAGPGDDDVPTAPGGVRFYTVDWAAPAPLGAGLALPARVATAPSANLVVDLDATVTGRVIVSLTYRSAVDTTIAEWDGATYRTLAPLPATQDDTGATRWFRTTLELGASPRFDYQPAVPGTNVLLQLGATGIAVHRLEATPL